MCGVYQPQQLEDLIVAKLRGVVEQAFTSMDVQVNLNITTITPLDALQSSAWVKKADDIYNQLENGQ